MKKPINYLGLPSIALPVLASLLSGCGNSGGYKPQEATEVKKVNLQPGKEATLFPLKEGIQWNYESEVTIQTGAQKRNVNQVLTFRVTKVTTAGARTDAVIVISDADGKTVDQTAWAVDENGIYQTAALQLKTQFKPAQMVVKFPIKDGEEFKQTLFGPVSIGIPSEQSNVSRVVGWQDVDTDMGRVRALSIESIVLYKQKKVNFHTASTTWWAPGLGLVRLRQETIGGNLGVIQTLRLKSKTPKD